MLIAIKFMRVLQSKFSKINPLKISNKETRAQCAGAGSAFCWLFAIIKKSWIYYTRYVQFARDKYELRTNDYYTLWVAIGCSKDHLSRAKLHFKTIFILNIENQIILTKVSMHSYMTCKNRKETSFMKLKGRERLQQNNIQISHM